MIARLPARWHATGDTHDGCSRYAHPGGIKQTFSFPRRMAHDVWLSCLYASHSDWSYRGVPAGLRLLAHSLPQRMLAHPRQCARPGADWPLHSVLRQPLYGDPGALYPGLCGDCTAHRPQEARPMGAPGSEWFSPLVFRPQGRTIPPLWAPIPL
jgi:hypothetical protein